MTPDREHRMFEAQARAGRAHDLIMQFHQWQEEASKFAPAPHWSRTKKKDKTAEAIIERLRRVVGEPNLLRDQFDAEDRRADEARAADEKAKQQRAEVDALDRLRGEAVEWLLERGRQINVDFTVDRAVEVANEMAFTEAVDARMIELRKSGDRVSFNGDEYCEGCDGWDGESRRCECDNRRVSWVRGWDHSFRNPSIEAEAF